MRITKAENQLFPSRDRLSRVIAFYCLLECLLNRAVPALSIGLQSDDLHVLVIAGDIIHIMLRGATVDMVVLTTLSWSPRSL
jgi:hypothetical protein